jgi:hypothetical protein
VVVEVFDAIEGNAEGRDAGAGGEGIALLLDMIGVGGEPVEGGAGELGFEAGVEEEVAGGVIAADGGGIGGPGGEGFGVEVAGEEEI